jgi:hypothetical protein
LSKTYSGGGEGEAPADSDAVGERVAVEERVPVWLVDVELPLVVQGLLVGTINSRSAAKHGCAMPVLAARGTVVSPLDDSPQQVTSPTSESEHVW